MKYLNISSTVTPVARLSEEEWKKAYNSNERYKSDILNRMYDRLVEPPVKNRVIKTIVE